MRSRPLVGAERGSRSYTYPRRGLHGDVVHELGKGVVSGDFRPGSTLPNEDRLMLWFDVSRTVVREAIKVLAAKGLVDSRPGVGTRVQPRNLWPPLDPDVLAWQLAMQPASNLQRNLIAVRLILEPAAARLAAVRATPEDMVRIEYAWRALEGSAGDPEQFIASDLLFHDAIVAATENELLEQMVGSIGGALRANRLLTVGASGSGPDQRADRIDLHRPVFEALWAGAGDAAERAMREVIETTARDTEEALGAGRKDS